MSKLTETSIKKEFEKVSAYRKIMETSIARSLFWLAFSFLTIAFFLLVAIRPTLLTIAQLRKEIKDKTEASQKLQEKIVALVKAQENYGKNIRNLSLLEEALPKNSEFVTLANFLETTAMENGVNLKSLELKKIDERDINKEKEPGLKVVSFDFSLTGEGEYPNIRDFLTEIENWKRILNIYSFDIKKMAKLEESTGNKTLSFNLSGEAYFVRGERSK